MSTLSCPEHGLAASSNGVESAYPGSLLNLAAVGEMAFWIHTIRKRGISASSYAIPRIDLDQVHFQ